jgi:hypothetical protein
VAIKVLQKQTPVTRDSVFVAGGQPSVTYVNRDHLKIEDNLRRAMKVPNQIVSLAGPTKTGKTVLVRQILDGAPYVWIEGGQIETTGQVWEKVCYVLNYPVEISKSLKDEEKISLTAGIMSCTRFRRHRVRCFMEQEVCHGETSVYARVQA